MFDSKQIIDVDFDTKIEELKKLDYSKHNKWTLKDYSEWQNYNQNLTHEKQHWDLLIENPEVIILNECCFKLNPTTNELLVIWRRKANINIY